MDKTKAVLTAGVDIQKDRVEYSLAKWPPSVPGEAPLEAFPSSLMSGPDIVESTLAAVLESRLAACQVAHLTSEATACAEAVKAAFETLRAAPAATE